MYTIVPWTQYTKAVIVLLSVERNEHIVNGGLSEEEEDQEDLFFPNLQK